MASWLRPRNLAIAYGAFVAGIFLTVWWFTRELAGPWYGVDTSRWVYAVYAIVGADILVGVGTVAALRSAANAHSEMGIEDGGADPLEVPMPLAREAPDHTTIHSPSGNPRDKDIDRLLESLHEIGTSAAKEAEDLEDRSGTRSPARRSQSASKSASPPFPSSASWLAGPASAALFLLGVSAAMLPNVEGFLESHYALNALLVLGMSFSLMGLGAYLVVTVLAPTRG